MNAKDAPEYVELIGEALQRRGEVRLRVHGGSMWPWVRGGDEVTVTREEITAIVPGAVVLCRRGARLVVHRVMRRGTEADGSVVLFTKGDAMLRGDRPVTAAEYLGRVTAIRRGKRDVVLDSVPQALWAKLRVVISPLSGALVPLARAVRRRIRGN